MSNRPQGRQGFELGDYVDVATRIAEFRAKYPEGSLRPVNPEQPYRIEQIGGDTFITYTAAAYRSPDDKLPGIGVAQEAYPGRTPYTRGSEIQNAETSAWGRAIVAALAADTKRGIASAEEVRNRQAERDAEWESARPVAPAPPSTAANEVRAAIARSGQQRGMSVNEISDDFREWSEGKHQITTGDVQVLREYLAHLQGVAVAA